MALYFRVVLVNIESSMNKNSSMELERMWCYGFLLKLLNHFVYNQHECLSAKVSFRAACFPAAQQRSSAAHCSHQCIEAHCHLS